MAQRTDLRAFQERLTHRLTHFDGHQASAARLGFRAGGRSWLVDLDSIEEVLPVPPMDTVPLTQRWYAGVANVRGSLYSVVDLGAFMDQPGVELTRASRILLLKSTLIGGSALLIDGIAGLRNPASYQVQEHDGISWISGLLLDEDRTPWYELDVKALTRERAFLEAGLH